jgi:hypothetical protein
LGALKDRHLRCIIIREAQHIWLPQGRFVSLADWRCAIGIHLLVWLLEGITSPDQVVIVSGFLLVTFQIEHYLVRLYRHKVIFGLGFLPF